MHLTNEISHIICQESMEKERENAYEKEKQKGSKTL